MRFRYAVRFRSMCFGVGMCVLTAAPCLAQTTTGTIQGIVRDESGGALPGVQVVANSPALIQKDLTVYSNQEGYYRLPLLPPGTYSVTYLLSGFRSVARTGLIVNAGQATSVDIELKLAALAESVTVIGGESPMVDPTDAKLAVNYTSSVIENIPSSRDFAGLVGTISGIENDAQGKQNVMGAGVMGNVSTVDGANATDPRTQRNQMYLMSYDIMDEVQVLKGGKPAEVGFAQGGFFQVVTKSGGNDFHGVGAMYYQNHQLQGSNLTPELSSAGFTTTDRLIDATDPNISAGWRFVRDKLWWFGSYRRQKLTREALGFPLQTHENIDGYFWKNTYQMHPRHRFTGGFNYWSDFLDYSGAGPLAQDPNALGAQDWTGKLAFGRWNGVLTENVLVDAGASFSRVQININEQPGAGIAVTDLVTGFRYRNFANLVRDNPSYNYDFNGALSWFVPDAMGRHSFKFGAGYTRALIPGHFTQKGDIVQRLARGVPSQVTILTTPADVEVDENLPFAYAQDSWTIANKLTLNLGVRYDRVDAFATDGVMGGGSFADTALADQFPELKRQVYPGRSLVTWNSTAPRLAAAWVLDPRTTIKGSASRYYHFMQTTLLPGTGVGEVLNLNFEWNDRNGDTEFQVGEQGRLLRRSGGGGRATLVDPDIRHPYTDELIAGFSRELFADFSINANFIYRRDTNVVNQVNVGVPFSTAYQPIQVADPGDDGLLGTSDDGSLTVHSQDPATRGRDQFLLTNPNRLGFDNDRIYRAFEFVASKRLSNRWQFIGSFLASRMSVVQITDQGFQPRFSDPNVLINTRGRDPQNEEYVVKLQGTYQAPYGIVLSGFYRYSSGTPYTRQLVVRDLPQGVITVFAEPRGSREDDAPSVVDFRVEKTLRLQGSTALGLILDVFNLNNSAAVLEHGARTGVDLGAPRRVQTPRIARLGARLTW